MGTLLEKETCLRVLDQPQVGAVVRSDTWDNGLMPWDGWDWMELEANSATGNINPRIKPICAEIMSSGLGCCHSAVWASAETLKTLPSGG